MGTVGLLLRARGFAAAVVGIVMAVVALSSPASAAVTERNVYYTYDLMGRQLTAKFDSVSGADGITNTYNGFGDQLISQLVMGTYNKTVISAYDGAGRRTQLTHPDGQAFTYAYDNLSRLTGVYEGVGTGAPVDTFTYGTNGLLASRIEAGGSSVTYGWDDVGRLTSQSDTFTGGTGNVGWTFSLNPVSQITSETRDNDSYVWNGAVSVNRTYSVNGLNQYTVAGPASFTYDANGNLTSDGTSTFTYDVENRLVQAVKGATTTNLIYDPLGRLVEYNQGTSASTRRFVYDGDAIINELNGDNALAERYLHGSNAAADDPLVWYPSPWTGLANKMWFHADHLGSIIARTDASGANPVINTYDEYGIPGASNSGRFQYTGQVWLAEIGMYYYKARIYSPTLGRFLQTDPIGYKDQINLYAYVGDDPINGTDPSGTYVCQAGSERQCDALDAGIRNAKAAFANLRWTERLSADRALNAYGTRGVANGVVVYANPNVQIMTTATLGPHNTQVAVNDKITSARQLTGAGSSPGGNVLHEGSHIYDGQHALGGRNWQTYTPNERLWLERRAYSLQGKLDRALGWSGRGADPLWKPGITPYQMNINTGIWAWSSAGCTRDTCDDPYGK
jgi:RHS repeat-associated protein